MTDLIEPVINSRWIIFDDGSVGSVGFEEGTEPALWAPGRFVTEAEHDAALDALRTANAKHVAKTVEAEQAAAREDFDEMLAAGVPERVARRLSGHQDQDGGRQDA